jgi:hypothetical protein
MTRANVRNYLITLCIFLAGCGNALTVGGASSNPALNYSCPTGSNVMPLTVNGSLCNAGTMYINMPCVSVTICYPGSLTNCQTINNILLDTGSFGLRIFSSLVNLSPVLPQTSSGDMVECAQFGSGRTWGPIVKADVYLASEPKANVPIQLINSGYESGESTLCAGADQSPSTAGYNGILGVGLNNQDCGANCNNASPDPQYYLCTAGTCSDTTTGGSCSPSTPCGSDMPIANQVANPVPNFSSGSDTNGEVLFLPALNNGGNVAANGCVVFGIGTNANNTPGAGVDLYKSTGLINPPQSDAEFTVKTTSPANTTSAASFIDSGSNAIYAPSSLGFTNCSGWYCPSNLTTVSITINSVNTGGPVASSFLVTNADGLFQTANYAFNDLSGNISAGTVDLGINYFYGRPIWIGVETETPVANINGTLGNSTNAPYGYWAY